MSRMVSRYSLTCATLAIFVAAVPMRAFAADVALDDLVVTHDAKSTVKIRHVDVAGTNLTQDELRSLFTGTAGKTEASALLGHLEASRISIPEISVTATGPDGGVSSFRDLVFTDVAKGHAGRVALGGAEGAFIGAAGPTGFKAARLTLDDVDVAPLLSSIGTGDGSKATARFARATWEGFEATVPDKDTPATAPGGNIISIALRSMTMNTVYDGDVPVKSAIALDNLTIALPKASQGGASLAAIGYDKLDVSLRISASYDAARRTVLVDDLSVTAADFGTLALRGEFGGIDKATAAGSRADMDKALADATFVGFGVRFVNAGGFDKIVGLVATGSGKKPAAVKAEWSAMAAMMIPAMLGGDPAGATLSSAATGFIADPKSVSVTFAGKAGPVPFTELQTVADPAGFLAKIKVDAVSEGGATAPAPAPAAAPAAAPAPAAAAPATSAKLTGLAAWNALVGNTVSGKSSDDEELIEFYLPNGKVKQSLDGELATGKWTVKGQKVCFLFPDDDGETCYGLKTDGATADFTDDEGGVTSYQILKGNPKNL